MNAARLTDVDMRDAPVNVLVVEDEVLIRIDLSDEFRTAGFNVLDASNGDEALVTLEATPDISLVITDIRMPGRTDGIALAHWLRQHRPEVLVVLVSGHLGATEMSPVAPDLVLQKPVNPARLVKKAREMLEMKTR